MIKTVIIDDEKACRESIKSLLLECCDDVEICGMADSVESGYKLITETKPHLVFLDIMMPPDDGFTLLKMFPKLDFEVVFTTAYSQYAIQAIKMSALDYLLKPVSVDDLKATVQKVREKHNHNSANNYSTKDKPVRKNNSGRLVIQGLESYVFVDPNDIVRAEASTGHKTLIKLKNNREIIACKDLGDFEEVFEPYGYQRVHRSHIINCREITKYFAEKGGGSVLMSDGKLVPVSTRKKEEFLKNFGVA